ncbi:MAG TPA: AraC family transcriptional regulator [Armatimonadaceae bacterium]|nr:AraC family transcriptional regulator [Armatimonadaceae bacterium]
MDISLLHSAEVTVSWAAEHAWAAGEGIYRHSVADYALWCVLSGEATVALTGGDQHTAAVRASAGSALLLPAAVTRDIETRGGAHWLSVGLRATLFGRLDLLRALEPPRVWTPDPEAFDRMAVWMRQIAAEWTATALPRPGESATLYRLPLTRIPHTRPRDPFAEWTGVALAMALVAALWREWGAVDPRTGVASAAARIDAPDWLTRTLDRVRREPGVEVQSLARTADLSEAQFRRVFHAWVGVSPQSYLTRVRLDEARRLLLATDLTVVEIAARVGFDSPHYFSRLFRQHFDAPPARWRHEARTPNL